MKKLGTSHVQRKPAKAAILYTRKPTKSKANTAPPAFPILLKRRNGRFVSFPATQTVRSGAKAAKSTGLSAACRKRPAKTTAPPATPPNDRADAKCAKGCAGAVIAPTAAPAGIKASSSQIPGAPTA